MSPMPFLPPKRSEQARVERSQQVAFARFLTDLEQRMLLLLEEADRKVDATLKEMLCPE